MTRVLFTGDRNWHEVYPVDVVIGGLEAMAGDGLVLIEGEARGLDRLVRTLGEARHQPTTVERFPARWQEHHPDWCRCGPVQRKNYCPAAGNRRNQQMLDEGKPEVCFAFHDSLPVSKGTIDMIERCLKAGIPVIHIEHVDIEKVKRIRRWQRNERRRNRART